MATGEKPYRVYKGGRVKGKVPLERPQRRDRGADGRPPAPPRVATPAPPVELEEAHRRRRCSS